MLYEKTLKPVDTGGIVNGYVFFMFNRDKSYINVPGTTMEIVFSDVAGKRYSIPENRFPINDLGYDIPYTPGVELNEKKLIRKK